MTDNKRPLRSWKLGSVDVAAWRQEGVRDDGTKYSFLSFSVQRSYKDKNGVWHRQCVNGLSGKDVSCFAVICRAAAAFDAAKGSGDAL